MSTAVPPMRFETSRDRFKFGSIELILIAEIANIFRIHPKTALHHVMKGAFPQGSVVMTPGHQYRVHRWGVAEALIKNGATELEAELLIDRGMEMYAADRAAYKAKFGITQDGQGEEEGSAI